MLNLSLYLAFTLLLDAGAAIALFALSDYEFAFSFENGIGDVVVLSAAKAVAVPLLCLCAVWMGRPAAHKSEANRNGVNVNGTCPVAVDINTPLIGFADEEQKETEDLKDNYKQTLKNARKKNVVLAAVFTLTTSISVYLAIKCVSYKFGSNKSEIEKGSLLAAIVLTTNLSFFLCRRIANKLTKEEGRLVLDIHNHRIYFKAKMPCHWCDVCHTRIREAAYRCKTCDFDVCKTCFNRKMKKRKKEKGGQDASDDDEEMSNWGFFIRALKFAWPYKTMLFLSATCLIVNSAASLALPNFQGRILDYVYKRNESAFWGQVNLLIAMSVAQGILSSLRGCFISIVGRKIATAVRVDLFKSIVKQDIHFFDKNKSGQLISRLTNDVNGMVAPWRTMLDTILSNTLMLFGGLGMCAYTSWKLSMIALTSIGPIIFITAVYANWSRTINREIWSALGDANAVANEALANIRTVRAFSTEPAEMKKYGKSMNYALSRGILDAIVGSGSGMLTNYLDLAATCTILAYGGYTAMTSPDTLSPGSLLSFQLYWNMVNSAYRALNGVINSLTRAAGAAQRVLSLVDSLPNIDADAGIKLEKSDIVGKVELKNVTFRYKLRPENVVLDGISLTLEAGKTTALVGRSGGGKSTIVSLLLRYYDPVHGGIFLDENNLVDLNLRALHRHVGLVAQETQLFAISVYDNITYGLDESEFTREDVVAAAKAANAHDFIVDFEEGYQTLVGERGVRLSGGQKQRISIARCFLRQPKILLLDEATSALDTESEGLVQASLDALIAQGQSTCLVVAHRLSTVIDAHAICVVDGGKIAERGTHAELIAKNGIYAKLVSRQMQREANQIGGADVIDDILKERE